MPWIISWFLVVGGLAVLRVWGLQSNYADLGYYVHLLSTVWTEGLWAIDPLTEMRLLTDHWSPLLIPLAPLAATSWGGYWLVLAQALNGGAAIWFARRLTDGWIATAYALTPALMAAYFFDIHANVISLPFLLMCVYGFRHSPKLAVIGGWLAAMGREDVALVILFIGLFHFRTLAGKLVVLGAVPNLVLWYFNRQEIVYNLYWGWFDEPGRIFEVVWQDGLFLLSALALLIPWTFFKLDWRYVALALLISVPWWLADSPIPSTTGFQYWALPVTLMLCAVRPERKPVQMASFAGLGLVMGPLGLGLLSFGPPSIPEMVGEIDWTGAQQAHSELARVDGSVSLPASMTPLSGHIREVYIYPHPFEPLYHYSGDRAFLAKEPIDVQPDYVIPDY